MNKREINDKTSIYPTLPSLLFIVFCLKMTKGESFSCFSVFLWSFSSKIAF